MSWGKIVASLRQQNFNYWDAPYPFSGEGRMSKTIIHESHILCTLSDFKVIYCNLTKIDSYFTVSYNWLQLESHSRNSHMYFYILASRCIPHTQQSRGRGNLVLKHFVLHFPLKYWGIVCWVVELNADLPERGNKNIN